jgi:hypothetical protein
MSQILPSEPMNVTPGKDAPVSQNITGPSGPKNQNGETPKRSHHKKSDPTTSNSKLQPVRDTAPAEGPSGVGVEVEAQVAPAQKSGGLVGLLKQAKARADINDDPAEDPEVKRSHKKGEGTGRPRGRPTNEANRDEFSTLVFTILTIVISFANLPPEVRPVEDEVRSLAYNVGSILARHMPALGNLSPDIVDIMGITATLAVWYQRVGPELKRMQAEREGAQAPVNRRATAENPNGRKPQTAMDEGPADPIADVSGGAGDFLKSVHKGSENDK